MRKLFVFLGLFLSLSFAQAQTIRYVKTAAQGTGNGTSWANASSNIQAMIDTVSARGGGQVWIAGGTYSITTTLTMKDSVNIYGSFAGNETKIADRLKSGTEAWEFANPTVLDGLNARLVLDQPSDFAKETVFDGLTITKGLSNNGGGGVCMLGNAVLTNSVICNNVNISTGRAGGGIRNSAGKVSHCLVRGNTAYAGGGIFLTDGGIVSHCTVSDNTSTSYTGGGGIYISNGTVSHCIISNNTVSCSSGTPKGGGIIVYGTSFTVSDCVIENNRVLVNNVRGGEGGGVHGGTLIRCVIKGNSAGEGGGLYNSNAKNCLIINNTATNGGGYYATSNTYSTTNCTYYGNTATTSGGGVYAGTHTNCIIWGNAPSSGQAANTPQMTYSDIQGWTSGGTGNKNTDPLFVSASAGNYQLKANSPCLSAGLNAVLTTAADSLDIDNNKRPFGATVDMGCYELQGTYNASLKIRYVKPVATGTRDGSSWANASNCIQSMITLLDSGQVWIAAGYYPITSTLIMKERVNIYGSFAGNENNINARQKRDLDSNGTIEGWEFANPSVLDGQNATRILLQLTPFTVETVCDGLTLTKGKGATGGGAYIGTNGKLINSIISKNTASVHGGGVYSYGTISHCLITENTAGAFVGGDGSYNSHSYSESVQTRILPPGMYQIECWGGNGGMRDGSIPTPLGGKGGYSVGTITLTQPTTLYIVVGGGHPSNASSQGTGYNGGAATSTSLYGGGGGGATHVATSTGILSSLSSNRSAVLIVAGGGGGGGYSSTQCPNIGGAGGGLSGGNGELSNAYTIAGGGTQSAGGAGGTGSSSNGNAGTFGQGGSGRGGGGGGGWYGGGGGGGCGSDASGGGGSGYIGGVTNGVTAQIGQTGFVANPMASGHGYVRITPIYKFTDNNDGGGIYNDNGTVSHCLVSKNTTTHDGGGIYSTGVVTNCTVTENTVANVSASNIFGGGIYINDGTTSNCIVSNNTVSSISTSSSDRAEGGGITCNAYYLVSDCIIENNKVLVNGVRGGGGGGVSFGTLNRCIIRGNSAGNGGGLSGGTYGITVKNCLIYGNTATNGGGAYGSNTSVNCTYSGNTATSTAKGVSGGTYTNCIIWGNGTSGVYGGTLLFVNSCLEGAQTGTGCINANPLFIDTAAKNYQFHPCSPCADAGDNTVLGTADTTDLAGKPRIFNGTVDMGAYELQTTVKPDIKITSRIQSGDLVLETTIKDASCQWSNSATTPSIIVTSPDKYWVKATYGTCSADDTTMVQFQVNDLCENNVYNFYGENLTHGGTYAKTISPNTYKLTLTIKPAPMPVIDVNGFTLSTTQAANSYQWYKDGSPISGATTQTYTCTQNGNYSLKVTYSNGCEVMTPPITMLSIVEANSVRPIQVYPNPTTGQLRITNYELRENSVIEIYDVVGKKQNAECRMQNGVIEMDISHLSAGLYYLKVDGKVFKVVKN